jgi:cell division protein FtsB
MASASTTGLRARVSAILAAAKLNRRRAAIFGAAALALSVGYHVIFGPNGLIVYEAKRNETKSLESEVKRLQQENERLKDHVDHLASDPNAIEHEARAQLHYARPGEVIYRLEEPQHDDSKDSTASAGN